MTNPINKKTHEQFLKDVKHLDIKILEKYVNSDTKIMYKCKHGIRASLPWQLKKSKYCCPKAYHENRIPPNIKTLKIRKEEIESKFGNKIDVSEISLSGSKILNLRCVEHNIVFDNWIDSLKKGHISCPECKKRNWSHQWHGKFSRGSYVSKSETKWLDEIGIIDRQVWLDDIKYKVDGFDQNTNTVYLYHGRFWHGCPETFNPEEIHPVTKLKMKELYEKTISWENKIKSAGYNLVVKWGT